MKERKSSTKKKKSKSPVVIIQCNKIQFSKKKRKKTNHNNNNIQPTNPNKTLLPSPTNNPCVIIIILIPNAPLKLPWLVLPNSSFASIPVCPFEVAKTEGLIVAVPAVFVKNVVENVVELPPEVSVKSDVAIKTSAAEGAGTVMEHVPGVEQEMVWMFSVPSKRPSEAKLSPKV